VDANQKAIVAALRSAGASVASLHGVGGGVPDLAVGYRGANHLLEVKNPARRTRAGLSHDASRTRRDTAVAQQALRESWRGSVVVVWSVDEALQAIGATR
jgi:hypothetical protein